MRAKRPLVLLVVIGVAAAWIGWRDASRTSHEFAAPFLSTAASSGSSLAPKQSAEPERIAEPSPAAADRVAPSHDSLEELLAAGVIKLTPNPENGLPIRVVRRDFDQPDEVGEAVGGALIETLPDRYGWLAGSRAARLLAAKRDGVEPILVRADSAGHARVPRTWSEMVLLVEAGTARGIGAVYSDWRGEQTKEREFRISGPMPLRVQALSGDGTALAGVMVRVHYAVAKTEGAEGIATFADLGLVLSPWSTSDRTTDEKPGIVEIALELPYRSPPSRLVDLRHVPVEPVQLELPPCGTLHVVLVDAERHRVDVSGCGKLVWYGRPEGWFWFEFEHGEATFPGLEPDQRFQLELEPSEHAESHVEAASSPRAGETTTIEVPIATHHMVLTGRAVDLEGRPLRKARLQGVGPRRITTPPGGLSWFNVTTEEDGTFRADWSKAAPDEKEPPDWIEWRLSRDPTLGSRRRRLSDPRPPLVADGEIALGDVSFETVPLLVHGVVVDDAGAPIPFVDAAAERVFIDPAVRDADAELPLHTKTDDRGHFELRSFAAPSPLTLWITTDDSHQEIFEVALAGPGSELRLVLVRDAALEGSVARPAAFERLPISLRLRSEDGEMVRDLEAGEIEGSGRFRIGQLPPGRYELEVQLAYVPGHGEALMLFRDLVALPGATIHDARLDPIDPWRALRFVTVSASRDGVPVAVLGAATLGESGGLAGDCVIDGDGPTIRVPTTRERVDLAVSVEDGRPVIVREATDRASAVWQPRIPVTFVLGELPPQFPKWTERKIESISLRACDDRFPVGWCRIKQSLASNGSVSTTAPLPGRYRGWISFEHDLMKPGGDSWSIEPFDLADTQEGQTITLVPKPDGN